MKKNLLVLLVISMSLAGRAQYGPILLGLSYQGGANGTGSLLRYQGGDTTLNSFYSLPPGGCPGCGPFPYGSLLRASDGKFYGLTYADGSNYAGTLFRYDYPTNTYTVMANFNVTYTGEKPEGSLMQASNGLLYGLTSTAGGNSSGTLFSYQLGADSVIRLINLPAASGTTRLNSLIQAANGKLYGMSAQDGTNHGGTIFEYDISGRTYAPVYNLPTSAKPNGDLLELGADTLYGMTQSDGTNHNGTIFRFIVASGNYSVLYNFDSIHGGHPQSSLIHASDGKLYGTTYFGGSAKAGVLFSFDPSTSVYADLHDFTRPDSGGLYPDGSPFQASDGMIYGMASGGGISGGGTIYRYNIGTSTFTQELSLVSTAGAAPYGHFVEYPTPPHIQTQPLTQSVCPGTMVNLTATATGDTAIQWQISTNGGQSYSNIAGANSSTYGVVAIAQSATQYRVIFSNANGSDTTTAATVTVYGSAANTVSYSLCQSSSYTVGSHTYTIAGTYSDTLTGASSHGCDSIVTLHLSGNTAGDTVTVNHATCSSIVAGASYQWLDCATHLPISGATSQAYAAMHNGSYRCVVKIGSCIDTSNCVSVTGVGISDVNAFHFNLYPNPTSGTFMIENDYSNDLRIEIINIMGKKIQEFKMDGAQQIFDISDLAAGMYEVQILTGMQPLKVLKLVKE